MKTGLDSHPAVLALMCKTLEGWSAPWWPPCALTHPKPFQTSKLSETISRSERSMSLVVVVNF